MLAYVNKLHYPVTSLGPGRRLGVWLQGCSLACSSCVSQDTWKPQTADSETTVESVLSHLLDAIQDGATGLTVSGGEPFQQPDALYAILDGARRVTAELPDFDILVYSGYAAKYLEKTYPWVGRHADALITGRFVADKQTDLVWRGSENQELVPLSRLGFEKYSDHIARRSSSPAIQLSVDETIWLIGVPRVGDMARVEEGLRSRGVAIEGASWRS